MISINNQWVFLVLSKRTLARIVVRLGSLLSLLLVRCLVFFFNFFTVFSFSMYYISVFVCISPLLNCVNVKKVRKNKIILDNVVWIYQIVYKKNLPLNLLRVFFVVIINTSFLTQSYICVWFVFNYFFVVYACVFRLLLYCWAWIWKAAAPKVVLFSHVI